MLKSGFRLRLFAWEFIWAFVVLLALLRPGAAQRALPEPALLPGFNPLCDGPLLQCLRIDELAGHASAQLLVLPRTDRRDTAVLVPFGVTLGLLGRLVGGISTHYGFWREGDAGYQQLGPLRLSLTIRLLPLVPVLAPGGGKRSGESGQAHYVPPSGLQLGLSYQHEVRVGQLDGANALGLLTDLASLRLVGSRTFGPLELLVSLGGAEAEAALARAQQKSKKVAAALEHQAERKALPPAPEPRGLLPGHPAPVKPPDPGRFIVDPKGNVLIEPRGGFTQGNATGTFVKTNYANGSPAYQLHEAHPKRRVHEPHGHRRGPGHGPEESDWGPSLDKEGHIVPYNSSGAHWEVKK